MAIAREAVDYSARYHAATSRRSTRPEDAGLRLVSTGVDHAAAGADGAVETDAGLLRPAAGGRAGFGRTRSGTWRWSRSISAAWLPPAESAPHLKRAVELDEARLAAAPDNRQAQLDTAISLAGLARVLESKGDLEESGRLYDRSVEIRRRIADTDRADVQAAGLLGSALIDAARVQRKQRAVPARESPRRRGGENPRGRAPRHQRPLGGNAPRQCVARARPGRRRRGGSLRVVPRAPAGERHVSRDRAGGRRAGIEDRSDARSGRVPVIGRTFKGRKAMPPAARVPDTSCWRCLRYAGGTRRA